MALIIIVEFQLVKHFQVGITDLRFKIQGNNAILGENLTHYEPERPLKYHDVIECLKSVRL